MKKWMIRALSALLIAAFLPVSVLADQYDLNDGSVTVTTTKQADGSTKQEVKHNSLRFSVLHPQGQHQARQ